MIALAFLIDGAMGVPNDSLGNLGSYHELASMFMKIGGAAFGLMLPVFAGYVAYSIAEKPGLVAGFVAGAIAKEGYAFGKSLTLKAVKQLQHLLVYHQVSLELLLVDLSLVPWFF